MNTAAYPKPNGWVSSYLVGANSYQILSSPEKIETAFLEEDSPGLLRSGAEHHYARVLTEGDNCSRWMVLFSSQTRSLCSFSGALEFVQQSLPCSNGFFWPFDLAQVGTAGAYFIHPIDSLRFAPIRRFLADPKAERWLLAKSLFRRIAALHNALLTLNGFAREQVRVDRATHEVFIWPDEMASCFDQSPEHARQGGYLSIPRALEQRATACKQALQGQQRDIFSAAVLAFYLLFYTHPFVGGDYWGLLRSDYASQYQARPEYIFDPEGSNQLGHQEFEQEILAQWGRTTPQLQSMFHGVFLGLSRPDSRQSPQRADCWNADAWVACLEADAKENDNAASRTQYPFEAVSGYRV